MRFWIQVAELSFLCRARVESLGIQRLRLVLLGMSIWEKTLRETQVML